MPRKTLPKMAVVRAADAFATTGEILIDIRPYGIEWPYPFVVNIALSIELYLKSYLTEDDLVPYFTKNDGTVIYQGFSKCLSKEHKLEKLYSQIPAKIKDCIEDEFNKSSLASRFSSFDEALEKFSNSFISARYPYEKTGFKFGCISDLMDISQFLKATIYKIGEIRDPDENS
ncbi:MAG: hypothetical protein PSN44_07555 [Gammaproteobacteria bacterium]|nr:hypothetical protein [Gammaproteobacteria bacterium]